MRPPKVAKVVPLADMQLRVHFQNGSIKRFDVSALCENYPEFLVLKDSAIFQTVQVEPGGYGISWDSDLDCSEVELWINGIDVPS